MKKILKNRKGFTGLDIVMSVAIVIIGITIIFSVSSRTLEFIKLIQEENKKTIYVEKETKKLHKILENDVKNNNRNIQHDYVSGEYKLKLETDGNRMKVYSKDEKGYKLEKTIIYYKEDRIRVKNKSEELKEWRKLVNTENLSSRTLYPVKVERGAQGRYKFVVKNENYLEKDLVFGEDLRLYFGIEQRYLRTVSSSGNSEGENLEIIPGNENKVMIFLKKVGYKRPGNEGLIYKEIYLKNRLGFPVNYSQPNNSNGEGIAHSYFANGNNEVRYIYNTSGNTRNINIYSNRDGILPSTYQRNSKGEWKNLKELNRQNGGKDLITEITKQFVASYNTRLLTANYMNNLMLRSASGIYIKKYLESI